MEKIVMKKTFAVIVTAALTMAAGFQLSAQGDPEGSLVYSLPSTSVRLEVKAQKESFFAGPYAKYAQKYLGVEARQRDAVSYTVTSVKMSSFVEADSRHATSSNRVWGCRLS